MAQGFNDNLYLIDLSYLNTPAEVVYDLSSILDTEPAKNQRVKLKLGTVEFNKSQLLSIKSLIESINSTLAIVDGKSEITRNSAIAIGLVYQNSSDMVPDTVFSSNNKTEELKKYVNEEAKPNLFPNTEAIERTVQENKNKIPEQHQVDETPENIESQASEEQENQEETNEYIQSETIEIHPPKFEPTEENLNFDNDNKKEWYNTQETLTVQSFENGFSNNNWAKPERKEEQKEEENSVINTDFTIRTEDEPRLNGHNNESQSSLNPLESLGIQSLEDIPLDIPNDKTIKEELDVIYSTERKLDDIFEKTGLKEEKFQSIKETAQAEEREYTQYDFEIEAFPTKYLKQTIFAGQFISYEGNLVIIGDCHEGSEISAAGDVTVWGNLSGSVHAGKNGNEKCKVRALHLNASQLKIANCFIKRPVALDAQSPVDAAPEEAQISKGEIAVCKIYK